MFNNHRAIKGDSAELRAVENMQDHFETAEQLRIQQEEAQRDREHEQQLAMAQQQQPPQQNGSVTPEG
jgi:hypothetical protein